MLVDMDVALDPLVYRESDFVVAKLNEHLPAVILLMIRILDVTLFGSH